MGTGKHYGAGGSSYGYGSGSSYKPSAPSYGRSYSYDPAPKYGATPHGASVGDKVTKFSSMEPKYGHSTDFRYPSLDRSTVGKDR